jgi:peptidoglycan/LPS O-acetylase OafA/YrhL
VLTLLLGVLFAFPGAGLFLGWSGTEDAGIHRFHTVVWGAHTGLVLSVGLLSLLVRSEERVATAQQVGVAMAVMIAVFLGSVVIPHFGEPGAPESARLVFSLLILGLTGVILALHPRRGDLLRSAQGISKPMAALGVIGLAVAAPYALDQIRIQLAVDLATDPHSTGGTEHWDEMASTALVLPLVALIAAFRSRGWRLVAWTAGIGTMVFGAASALMPEQASSPGVVWGAAALVGGVLFIVVAEIEARRKVPSKDGRWPRSPSNSMEELPSPLAGSGSRTRLGSSAGRGTNQNDLRCTNTSAGPIAEQAFVLPSGASEGRPSPPYSGRRLLVRRSRPIQR